MIKKSTQDLAMDYAAGKPIPDWVREVIEAHLAIEDEDAKSAGALGFMARALVIATMPYKDPKADVFKRVNGNFNLRIVAGYEGGIPYGIYPRLLMSWVATEAVRTQSPVIELGDSLRGFLRDVLDIRGNSGGTRGSATRVSEQMKRLFGSLITAQYSGTQEKRGFSLRNVLIAQAADLSEDDEYKFNHLWQSADAPAVDKVVPHEETKKGDGLWTPQELQEAGKWQSKVRLTNNFFEECITSPVPIDLRAYKTLRGSPLAMDVYTWLTYRMSYTERRSKPIRWESLMMQFGSNFASEQAVRDFKKAFLKALSLVLIVYPQAKVEALDTGLVLLPSRPHILPTSKMQQSLF